MEKKVVTLHDALNYDETTNIVSSKKMRQLINKYCEKFGENPPPFNYTQYNNGKDMLEKLTNAIETGKPLIPKKELSMFDL